MGRLRVISKTDCACFAILLFGNPVAKFHGLQDIITSLQSADQDYWDLETNSKFSQYRNVVTVFTNFLQDLQMACRLPQNFE